VILLILLSGLFGLTWYGYEEMSKELKAQENQNSKIEFTTKSGTIFTAAS
jgi:hypothetical protein